MCSTSGDVLYILQMWLTFAPIPDYTSKYYNISLSKVDWFSLVYFTVSLVMGFISIYILNKFSLKVSVSNELLLSLLFVVGKVVYL